MNSIDELVRRFAIPTLALAALLGLSASCSGDDSAAKRSKPANTSEPEWSIHLYAGAGAVRRRVDVGPIHELSLPSGGVPVTGALPASPADIWKTSPKLLLGGRAKPFVVLGWGQVIGELRPRVIARLRSDVVRCPLITWRPLAPREKVAALVSERERLGE